MAVVQRRPTRGSKRAPAPLALRLRRLMRRLYRALRHVGRGVRNRPGRRKGVEVAPTWRKRRVNSVIQALAWIGAGLFVLWVGRALWVVVRGEPVSFPFDLNPDAGCARTGFSCGVMGGIVMTLLSLALGTAIFLFYRLWHIRRRYVGQAKKNPTQLVPTAGAVIGDVVGRDELCNVIMDDLRERSGRRPHIIIGGVGTGKTAVLVQLTRVLAQNRAVPIAIRLRDAQSELDFRGLARKRFIAHAENALVSSAEGEKVWRQLLKDDRIVVLADGLEEAFAGAQALPDRDNLIRLAIAETQRQKLPLVIASRPHDPLSDMEAAMLDLEPLSQEAALEYLRGDAPTLDARLEWLVESAGVADAPLYLQIAKELHDKGLLRHAHPRQRAEQLDTRGVDQVGLRLGLIDTWMKALTKGHFHPDLALSSADRRSALEHLSALACIGLKEDSLHVRFDALISSEGPTASTPPDAGGPPEGQPTEPQPGIATMDAVQSPQRSAEHPLRKALEDRLAAIKQSQYVPKKQRLNWAISAATGRQLGLVEPYQDGIRFQHSIMQAYLGSRFIFAVADDNDFMDEALQDPGRELLLALVMYSRSRFAETGDEELAVPAQTGAPRAAPRSDELRNRLRRRAKDRYPRDEKTLDMLASALEIDAVVAESIQAELATDLAQLWKAIAVSDRSVEEAKLRAVARFGEAVRTVAERSNEVRIAYKQLFEIGGWDESYRVRIAVAQEIGVGGDLALEALDDVLDPTELVKSSPLATRKNARENAPRAQGDAPDEFASTTPEPAASTEQEGRRGTGRASSGGADAAKLTAAEQAPAADEQGAGNEAHADGDAAATPATVRRERDRRKETMRAWLVPMLVGSSHKRTEQASRNLEVWLDRVGGEQRTSDGSLPLAIEVALAQGFKHAANRRPEHPLFRADARDDLAERAREMLETARFWFSRLTLVHALCLWALPETATYRSGRRRAPLPPRSDPEALVDRWLSLPGGEGEHPFVTEARDLAVLALQSGQPERFIWIDESGVVTKVGTRTARPDAHRTRQLWIPPSTGWSTLHPRAQQLVGDVLLLFNLAERGRDPADRDRRLKRIARHDLPPCLTDDRRPLNPKQTIGTAKSSAPGSNCRHGCQFDLCPYPPKGEQTYRSELSEAFCRRQQTLLGLGRRGAPWQTALPKELKAFWNDMEERARR